MLDVEGLNKRSLELAACHSVAVRAGQESGRIFGSRSWVLYWYVLYKNAANRAKGVTDVSFWM